MAGWTGVGLAGVAGVLAVAAAPVGLAPDDPAADAERVVIAEGHVDIGPRFEDGAWVLRVRDDTVDPPVWRSLDDVVLHVTDLATVEVPEDEAFSFLGAPGDEVWLLPQAQEEGVLWPGWNTQDTEVATRVAREVTWSLHAVEGPGELALFLNGSFGEPEPVFDSREEFPQTSGVEVNTHVHGNWAFLEPGAYLLDIEMSARLDDGQQVSDRGTLRFFAGGGDPEAAFDTELIRHDPEPSGPAPDAAAQDPDPGEDGSTGGPVVLAIAVGVAGLVLVAVWLWWYRRARGREGSGHG
ncbi:TIGR03773 family transporter-associated surface protein [Actinoalloteichus spitiensis]|uniref:TIGR03773 family transporter-associated surface protein n=1 Tax=Actinoalloteichus spitiensis TaxID=252394 RepID=UPI00036740B0|nr:TIGR03773 family transporter-associated surface protein [Actinoalloteichus spitiensis]